MSRTLCPYPAALALCLLAGPAPGAEEPVGYVKTTTGEAAVVHAGTPRRAEPGTPVALGDVLRTGSDGTLGVTFQDNTVMSFGPDTELTVDEFLYAPQDDKLGLGVSLSRGTLHFMSGVIAKLRPAAVQVTTPTGIVGVRGTRFVVKVAP